MLRENPNAQATMRSRHISCGVCSKTFSTPFNLRRHEEIHRQPQTYPCKILTCNRHTRPFNRWDNLLDHINRVHQGGNTIHGSRDSLPGDASQAPGRGADDARAPKRKRESDGGGKLMHNNSKRTRADGETGLEGVDTDARDRRRLDRYMVGWICAMGTEYVAAQELLDEEHDAPDFVSPNDANHYTCGRLGKHDVVIAVPPDGEYGTSSAAQVATNMQQSFPNIRIVVMVGTGGGAPSSKHDIRLGDIVVSAPHAGGGGVFQYDFGDTTRDLAFRRVRFLNQLPSVLRTALTGIRAQHRRKGHRLEETVDAMLDKNPRLRQEYSRPAPDTDRLFEKVTDGAGGCAGILSNLVPRRERTMDEDNPAIHYGLIASANHLIKDATIRDGLIVDKDVLCFETEAAGLMDRFPCVVIRGICDYSDSHANKEWQGYAAIVAAAYAKDLLGQIAPNRIRAEKKICDILPGLGTDAAEQRGDVKEFVPKHNGGGGERMSAQEQNRRRPVRHASAAGSWDGKRETSATWTLATGFSSAGASDHG
ncbi:hypothetical protein MHUMG1_00991 [Metarhizium humberi]|uniref:C2H2-type domain-containing protein n=1 Tax=Metarhizium humberi TaxID=2596975 RepID=A0A9P8MLT5_9HYPO|nr:hypothetical protein MHUMG1_00991 [Metarhizium humberi]